MGRLLAVVLGVHGYQDRSMVQLRFAEGDASLFAGVLRGSVAQADDVLSLPSQSNAVDVMERLRSFLDSKAVRAGDRVLFAFAGHGVAVERADGVAQYLLLARARLEPLLKGHVAGNDVLSVAAVLEAFDAYPQVAFALLLDACRLSPSQAMGRADHHSVQALLSGVRGRDIAPRRTSRPKPAPAQGPTDAQEEVRARHLVVYSCPQDGTAYEADALKGGLFLPNVARWLRSLQADKQMAVIDEQWPTTMGQAMQLDAQKVGLSGVHQPWLSRSQPRFVLHRPELTGQHSSSPASEMQYIHEPWCPAMIHLRPCRKTDIPALAVMRDPVTWAQWELLMGRRPQRAPAQWRVQANAPVTWLSREEALLLAQRLTQWWRERLGWEVPALRLPTPSEWLALRQAAPVGRKLRAEDAVFRWSELGHRQADNPATPQTVEHGLNHRNALGLRGLLGNVREMAEAPGDARRTLGMGGGYESSPAELWTDHPMDMSTGVSHDLGVRLVRPLARHEILD